MNSQNFRCLVAAATLGFVALSFSAPSSAGDLNLGGLVGGTVSGTLGALGGSTGTSGGVSAQADASIGKDGIDAKASISNTINAKAKVVLHKKKIYAKILLGKHGSYSKHGKLANVTAVIGTKPVKVKAKILLGHKAKATVFASLGHKTQLTGKVAIVGMGASVNVGLNLGGFGGNNPAGNNGTPPGTSGSTPGAMAGEFRDLSMHDQLILTKKCSAVLAAPGRFDTDMVALCRIIATL